jgi:hypothetical protein
MARPVSDFAATISEAYATEGASIDLGRGVHEGSLILSEDGVPTPVVHTRLRAPASRMGPAEDVEVAAQASPLFAKYGTREEAQSAREMLAARLEKATVPESASGEPEPQAERPRRRKRERQPARTGGGATDILGDFLTSREGKAMQKKVMRGVFGMLRKSL